MRHAAHQLVSLGGVRGAFPAIEVDGQRHVALVSEPLRLLLHPVVQSPPLVDHNDSRMASGRAGQSEVTGDRFVAALVADGFALWRRRQKRADQPDKCYRRNQNDESRSHNAPPEGMGPALYPRAQASARFIDVRFDESNDMRCVVPRFDIWIPLLIADLRAPACPRHPRYSQLRLRPR